LLCDGRHDCDREGAVKDDGDGDQYGPAPFRAQHATKAECREIGGATDLRQQRQNEDSRCVNEELRDRLHRIPRAAAIK
jgi:hypothetical protein